MMNRYKKQLYLINGFLGSGKTTLMHNLINFFKDKKIAVIVNEFGNQGMDGLILQREGISIKEISNGSIFCSCRSDTFVDALVEISKYLVDIVLIESSGLSDPTGIGKIMSLVQNLTNYSYDYKGSIAVVDATNFEKLVQTAVTARLQILSSDLVIINKIDLVDEIKLDSVKKKVSQINPNATIVRTSYGKIVDSEWIYNLNNKNSLKDININKQKVVGTQKFLISMRGNYKRRCIEKWIKDFSPYFYRIKGFVNIDNKWHYVDGTSNQLEIKLTNVIPEDANIVVLAPGDQPIKKKMIESWKQCFSKDLVLL